MESQRHSRSWMLVASILLVGGLAAGKARADIYVHVMNCADSSTVKAEAFDAKDSVRLTPASSKDISTGENEQLHCAGEGKGYCQMKVIFKGNPEWCYDNPPYDEGLGFHLDADEWAVVTGFYILDLGGGPVCRPEVEQLDSQPKDCVSVCKNCKDVGGE